MAEQLLPKQKKRPGPHHNTMKMELNVAENRIGYYYYYYVVVMLMSPLLLFCSVLLSLWKGRVRNINTFT